WKPNDGRIFHASAKGMGRNAGAPVVAAIAYERPSIVTSGAKHVEFITAVWSLLRFPHFAGLRVYRKSMTVSMTDGEDTRFESVPPDERIIVGNAAIISQADSLAGIVVWILRTSDIRRSWSTDAHVQHAIAPKRNTRCFGVRGAGFKNVFNIDES